MNMRNGVQNPRIACLDIHSPLYLRTYESKFGGGGIEELYDLVQKAADNRFALIEITPIQDTGFDPCPYMGISLFSYNPAFLSVERISQNEEVRRAVLEQVAKTSVSDLVDYGSLYRFKEAVLRVAFHRSHEDVKFESFDLRQLAYAVFKVLQVKFNTVWNQWPKEYRTGNVLGIIRRHKELHDEIKCILFGQGILEKQWADLIKFASDRGVSFIMDKPIYPSVNSADVWANQGIFYLKRNGEAKYVSGTNIPGDPFGEQVWGHAVYQFKEKPDKVMRFFDQSIEFLAKTSDVIRLDHALAYLWKYYIYNPQKKSGRYVKAFGSRFLEHLKKRFPEIYFVAEDVGYVNEKAIDTPLQKYGIPGIRCLQWGSERYADVGKYPELSLAITSNHDTESMQTWWGNLPALEKEVFLKQFAEQVEDEQEEVWELVRLVFKSDAIIASIPLKDVIGDRRRFNLPGANDPSYWRLYSPVVLESVDFEQIRNIIIESKRESR